MVKAQIDFSENNKIRIIDKDEARDLHEICKLLIMRMTRRKHQDLGVYSEYKMPDGTIPDVTVDFGGNIVCYEIQKEITKEWLERIKRRDQEAPFKLLVPLDTIIIPEKEMPNNFEELKNKLKDYII